MAGILGDEISRQMDADLFGSPGKSTLDPKLSGEMDRDLGLGPSRPWAGAIKPPEPEEPGYLGALGKGIYAGFRRRLPEMTGQAIQFTGAVPETGKAITDWAREGEERPQFKSAIKQALYEGGEMLAPSVAIPAVLGAAGVGVLPASIATAGLFGLSQAQSTKEEAEKRGVEPGAAPYATGAIEAVGETVGTAALGRLLGPLAPILTKGGKVAVKDVIKPTVSRLLKEFPRTLAIEGGTEFGQQFGQALVEKGAGIRPEAEPVREGLGTLAPTAVLTSLTMGMAIPSQRFRARSVEKSLEDEKTAPENRRAAADYVASYMAEADEEFAKRWRVRADQAITKGEKIPVDQDIYEWMGEPVKGAPTEPKQAIPTQPQGYDLIARKPAGPEIQPEPGTKPGSQEPPAEPGTPPVKPKPPVSLAPAPAAAIPQPEETALGEAQDLLKALQSVPAVPTVPTSPEDPKYTEEQVRAALSGEEPAKAAIPAGKKEVKPPIPVKEEKRTERKKSKGYFPAENLWDKTVGEVQDEWSAFMFDYEDLKVSAEKELEPLRKELESLKGKRDKFSNVRKKELQKEIGQKEEIYKSIPAQAENDYMDVTQKFAGMVEEEARKKGIPEERIPDFVTDFQIYSSGEKPYIENNFNLSHREIFDELAKEYLAPEEKQQASAALPAAAIPGAAKEPWEIPKKDFIQTHPVESLRNQPGTDKPQFWEGYHAEAVRNALQKGKPVPQEVLKDYPDLQPGKAIPEKLEAAAAEAATSPANALPEPTEAQKEAGNYKKGHLSLHGLPISIENPRGSKRSGVSPEGKKWETTLAHHYGYIRGTKGRDKDHLDVFIGPYPDSEFVTVIDQVNPKTGKFDEHKVMIGFRDMASAQVGYLANYEPGWKGLGAAKGMDILEFKDWLKEGDTTKPIAPKEDGKPAPQEEIPTPERRKDLEKRKRISEMTPEEMKKELLTDPLTGLGNRRAYEESPRLPIQAMIDVDSLKAVNDIMGHEAGDDLLRAVGRSLQGLLVTRAYHTSGDEFIVEGPDRETVERQLQGVRENLAQAEIEATAPDGTTYKYKGLEISYGIRSTLKEADEAMAASKREREEQGLRAPRGERPKGMASIPAPGVEPEGKASGREIEEPKKLPANWLDTGWKIEQRGVLQIAISPEGKEYTLWGQRLEPIKEPLKAASRKKATRAKYALEEGESTEITQDLVQKAFPNARVTEEDYGYRVDLPNGQVIDVTREKEIALNRAAAERAYGRAIKPSEYPIAAFEKIGEEGIISLTEEGAGKIDEEVFHAAMAMALTPEERQSILGRYSNNEEQAARAYQDWLADENARPDTIWQKIKDFFMAIREALFPTERTAFKRIRSGEIWERKLKTLGPDAYDLGEATDQDVLYAIDKLKWAYPVKDSGFGTVNNRLSKELEVFEKLFGKSSLAVQIPGKYVDGHQETVRSISAHDLGRELFRVKESGLLARMADPTVDPKSLADELGFAGSDRDSFNKELTDPTFGLRSGSLYLELGEDGKPILSENGKSKMSADFLLATCQPTTPCKECYAAKRFIRISNVKKAFRNTVHILLDPEGWAGRVANEAARIDKTALPFIRLLGSGDLTSDEMVRGFNALAEKADRPIQIFSRHHDNLAKLKGTQKAPFLKMGSVDADLHKHYGFRFLRDNFKKRGIVNAWLYTDQSELPMVQRLYDADALGLILSAKVDLHEALPEPLQMSSCPCDAEERTYVSSCKQCALSEAGCFMSFAPVGVDAKGKLWEFMDPKAPSDLTPVTAFTAGIEEGKAKGYQSVFADRIAKSIKLTYLYIREFIAGNKPAIPLKDIQFPNDIKYTKNVKAAETYIGNLEAARERSEEGTFYIAGGRIQKPLRFTNWRGVEEEPKYALRDPFENSAFKAWFKDSKVVDEEGNPLQVYHGRVGDFTSFGRGPTELSRLGWYYFSDNPNFAEKFSYTGEPLREPEKATVKIASREGGMREVPGYRTDIPGLVIAQYDDVFSITHEQSGKSLVRADGLNTALDIVDSIKGTRINFNRDEESLSKLSPRTLKILRNAIDKGRGAELSAMFGYKSGAKGIGIGSNVVPAFLSIKNPLDLRELPAKNVNPKRLKEALAQSEIELGAENYFWSGRDLYQILNQADFARALKDAMREKGMDGIIFPDYYDRKTRGTTYIAFEPGQIKSLYNETFKPEDERINFALEDKGKIQDVHSTNAQTDRVSPETARLSPAAKEATAFKPEGPIRKFIDALKSPDFPARAGQDKGFKDMIRKNRLGLVKVTDNDIKLWERALSLPFWLQEKYKELRPLVHTQIKREESRSEIIHGLLTRARPFFDLKGEEMVKAEKALIEGDRGGKVYTDEELKNQFNLNPEGVAGYRAVRGTLDWIHREWKAKIEENILREYEQEKWFALFKAAHGLDFSEDESLELGKALKKTYKATEKPIETVKEHLQKIFEEKLTQEDKRLLLKDYVEAYNKARHQLDQVKRIVREAIGEGMGEEELNKNTRELVQAYICSFPAIQQLKEMRDELNRIRGYFPRSRKQGKYRVVVLDEVEYPSGEKEKYTVFYQNAANRIEATRLYNKVKADPEYKNFEIVIEPNRQEGETTFMGASAINMQRLVDNAIEKLKTRGEVDPGTANLIRLNVLETLADDLKARGAGRFAIKRAGNIIEGYQKTNLKEVLKDYIDGWSGMMTKQDAALEFLEELKEIPRNKPQLMAYASKYAQDMLRNQEPMDRISAKMRSLAFIYFLGGSLRAALVNFTQNYVTGIPFLAREVGAKSLKAEKLYHKAMFDVAAGNNINTIEQKMLDEMINKGVAEDQFIRQINREVKGAVGQATGRVVDILSKPFSWMEKLNRKSAALAMFREKYRSYSENKAYTPEEAYRKAMGDAQDFVYKTHYLMTKANLPSITAGGDIGAQFLKTAYTFRRFTHNYLLSLHHSLKGDDGKLALDVMARSLAYVVLLAGIPAIPFLDDLLDEWEKFFGTPVRSNMRKTLREAGGSVLEKMGMAGIPALMGIDISGSLKVGIPLAGSGTPQDTIYGVYGGLARKSLNAMSAAEREDYLRAMEFASPVFIEAVLKAYRMSETGATTPRGKVITDEQGKPIRLGAGEGIAQAAGFRPERLARVSGEHWTMENLQKHFKEKRDDLYSRYRLARTQEEKRGVIRKMQRFNMEARKYRGVIPPITATSMGQAAGQKPEKRFMGFGRMMETEIQ